MLEMTANGGLLQIGGRSPDSKFGHFQGEIFDSLRRIFEISPFLGDRDRRPGSICTAWSSLQCNSPILRSALRPPLMNSAQTDGLGIAGSIAVLVDETTDEFSFTNGVYIFPDDERPSFAGNVGAAVADLVMENLGFYWRANAGELNLKAVRDAAADTKSTPDYVYDPGGQHGFEARSVVIVEAKGSLSPKRAQLATIKRLSDTPHINKTITVLGMPPNLWRRCEHVIRYRRIADQNRT
jgi:hypothetical protein